MTSGETLPDVADVLNRLAEWRAAVGERDALRDAGRTAAYLQACDRVQAAYQRLHAVPAGHVKALARQAAQPTQKELEGALLRQIARTR